VSVETSGSPESPLVLTVITPSYNQAAFLPATLQSVADQDYPWIEHIVVDGGSTDGSVDILRGWDRHPIRWVSERDGGQADAINKGVGLATGGAFAWLNSDDVYLDPGAVSAVMAVLADHDVVTAAGREIAEDGSFRRRLPVRADRLSRSQIRHTDWILQPASFMRMSIARRFPLDPSLHWAMDWDLFIRVAEVATFTPLDREIAGYRYHPGSKTVGGGAARKRELARVIARYHGRASVVYLGTLAGVIAQTLGERLPGRLGRSLRQAAKEIGIRSDRRTDGHGIPF
jgi:glycosyltransferase involved in cell wall biosynthesis